MSTIQTVPGSKYGRLTVVRGFVKNPGRNGQTYWVCRCDCGNEVEVRARSVRTGHTSSCSCLNREIVGARHRKHGMYSTPIYLAWQTMIQRCENPKNPHYVRYGARGIRVCERWRTWENFYADMGERPTPHHSVDRIDNEKGYQPDNCRWATRREQMLNTRRSIAKRKRETVKKIGRMIEQINT